jgi:hypothetical protein
MPRAAGRDLDPDRERWGSMERGRLEMVRRPVACRMNVRMMSMSDVEVKVGCDVVRVVGVDVVERGMVVRRLV